MSTSGPAAVPTLQLQWHPLSIAGLAIDPISREVWPSVLETLVAAGDRCTIATCRSRDLLRAREDRAFHRTLETADLVIGTGGGMAFLGLLQGVTHRPPSHPGEVVGITLAAAARRGWGIFFLGSTDTDAFDFSHEAVREHPGLRVAGALKTPRDPEDESAAARLASQVNASGASILLCAPTTEGGETFMRKHRGLFDAPVVLSVFGGFRGGLKHRLQAPAAILTGYLPLVFDALRRHPPRSNQPE